MTKELTLGMTKELSLGMTTELSLGMTDAEPAGLVDRQRRAPVACRVAGGIILGETRPAAGARDSTLPQAGD